MRQIILLLSGILLFSTHIISYDITNTVTDELSSYVMITLSAQELLDKTKSLDKYRIVDNNNSSFYLDEADGPLHVRLILGAKIRSTA